MCEQQKTIDLPACYVDMIEACLKTIRNHDLIELVFGELPPEEHKTTIMDLQEVLDRFCTPLTENGSDTKIIMEDE